MEESNSEIIHKNFGNKLRVRVCGILIKNNRILLAKHKNLGKEGVLYAPPGGGLAYAESVHEALIREFKEECSVDIEVGKFLFTHEYLDPPLHAIELFFEVLTEQEPQLGHDPELEQKKQILEELVWMNDEELARIPLPALHSSLRNIKKIQDVMALNGFFTN